MALPSALGYAAKPEGVAARRALSLSRCQIDS